jgi:hypothetical protein
MEGEVPWSVGLTVRVKVGVGVQQGAVQQERGWSKEVQGDFAQSVEVVGMLDYFGSFLDDMR